jgi:mannosyltransferase
MQVTFDNIIYSLQRVGGISVVWTEILKRACVDPELSVRMLEYPMNNILRAQTKIPETMIIPKSLRCLERYREPEFNPMKPTIFHSSYFRICQNPNVHNVTTVHDLTYHFYRKGLPKAVHLWEEKKALKHSEAVICISENTKRDLLRFYPWIPEERIHVIYNGVSDAFYPMPEVEKKGYLLYVGNTSVDYKRYDVAQEVAKKTGLELVTASAVTTEQLNKMYNEALCLLYPSDYEGFGIPVIEAQKAGCPVIAQESSSIPEIIGRKGLMVKHGSVSQMADAMAEIVMELKSRPTNEIIQTGMENAKRFSWDKTYEQVKNVYREII